MEKIVALDLFAGTGWGVACKRLGIEEGGVELMDEAVATRTANGMVTLYRDVWDGLLLDAESHALLYGEYNLLIASPPCQTFSAAGKGAGRKALNEVLEAIREEAYKDPAKLLAFGEAHDIRTALVLSPLAYIWRDRPQLVTLEQVPTVQPVWEAYAEVMRGWGYQVETRILNAEQYGVPQTRRRAILVANLGGPVSLPTPTHSRYYSRTPEKLDPGVLKWVSMAEALGWGRTDAPCHTVTGGVHGPTDRWASGGNGVRRAMDEAAQSDAWIRKPGLEESQGRTKYAERFGVEDVATIQTYPVMVNGNQVNATRRNADTPSSTVCFGHNAAAIHWSEEDGTTRRVTPEEAAALQTYPTGRGLTDRPSPTITGGGTETGGAEPIAKFHERYTGAPGWQGSTERLSTDEAAALQSYPVARKSMGAGMVERHGERPGREADLPAFTIRASAGGTEPGGFRLEGKDGSTRKLEQEEAHILQTFPTEPPFIWCGSKSKVFLQIGNAVPPLLAQHILAALLESKGAGELI